MLLESFLFIQVVLFPIAINHVVVMLPCLLIHSTVPSLLLSDLASGLMFVSTPFPPIQLVQTGNDPSSETPVDRGALQVGLHLRRSRSHETKRDINVSSIHYVELYLRDAKHPELTSSVL